MLTVSFRPKLPVYFSGNEPKEKSKRSSQATPTANNINSSTTTFQQSSHRTSASGFSTPKLVTDGTFTPPKNFDDSPGTLPELFPQVKQLIEHKKAFDAWIASQAKPKFS